MKKEIVINVEEDESRVAVLEDNQLVQLFTERPSEQSIVSNVYKGRVTSILPGMQAAFVDIGIEKAGFLHVDDVLYDLLAALPSGKPGQAGQAGGRGQAGSPQNDLAMGEVDMDEEEEEEDQAEDAEAKAERERRKEIRNKFRGRRPGIQDLLRRDQEIMVQVAKDPIGTKGPRLTTRLSLAGRSLVLMPLSNTVGVSRRISDSERSQMKQLARKVKPQGMGLIIRTLGSGDGEPELKFEVEALKNRWQKIRKAYEGVRAPTLLYKEEALTERILREILAKDVSAVTVDDKETAQRIQEYVTSFGLGEDVKVVPYTSSVPLFEAYKLEKEIEKALRERVWLRSGGYLIIQPTEALTVVDVNTGKFIGKKSQDETIFRTNLEAAVEVARQLRLRDIGGIIVIDFIDMENADHKEKVGLVLDEAIRKDKAKTNILELTELGLVEMTRKRVKQSLLKELCQTCPYCEGRGVILSELSTGLKVLRMLKRVAIQTPERDLLVLVHPAIAAYLVQENSSRIRHLEAKYGVRIQIQDDYHIHREDIKILSRGSMTELIVPE
ncbi:MAG: Rne/Rng family ribonuclease [candidate division FCPU426 bacterium]